ncbi:MAG: fibronectin type III domain-containing protein [Spirosomataceae bacterium]
MYRLLLSILGVFSLWASSYAQPGTTMYVSGRSLYSAVGEKVVLRGVNEMFIYSPNDKQGKNILPQIAQTGANSVRLVWLSSGSSVDLDSLITNCIKNKMIPMVDLHDATGNWGNLQTCLNYWKRSDVVAVMQKHKKWVLLNIANEAGDASVTNDQFRTAYIDAITQLRGVGYTMPLIIDATDWGKNENAITTQWAAISQIDPQHNVIYSLHPYWVDAPTDMLNRFTALFNAVVSNNIPFIIGEGPEQNGWNCTSQVPYQWVMQQCQTLEIGWLAWSWGTLQNGDCQGGRSYDITTNGVYGNWTNDWGRLIAVDDPNSIKNTSIRPPSILGNVPPDTQAPTAPTNLMVSSVTSLSASLTWTASTDNVGVTSYDIYNGSTLVGSSYNTSANLTGLTCNTAYSFSVKAKDAAGNVSTASNTATATTSICDTQAPTTPTNLSGSNLSTTSVQLNWTASTDNVGVTGYQVFNGSTLLLTVNATTLVLTNLTCNTTYTFSVKAVDAANNASASSNVVTATTSTCPTGEVVYADNLNANWEDWSWSAYRNFSNTSSPTAVEGVNSIRVDYGGYGGFSVRRNVAITPTANMVIKFLAYSTGANSLDFHIQTDDGSGASSSAYLTTVPNQWQEYTVTMANLGNPTAIKRINIKNNSGNSPTVFIDYLRFDTAGTADTQAPTAPTNLVASGISNTGLTLSWSASSDNVGVTSYQVYQGNTLLNGNVTGTSLNISGLTCNTAYSFTVTAKDAAGNVSAVSNTASATTLGCDTQAPTAPSSLTASLVTASGLVLNWTAATDNVGVAGYQVYQGTTLLASNVTGTSYTVAGLTCATAYNFTVKAFDAAGNVSVASNTASATTSACSSGDLVYDDALNANWQDWSWGTTVNFSNTSPVQQGVNSIRADYSSYSGLSLRKNAFITPSANLVIKFWVYSTGANSLLLFTQNDDSGTYSSNAYFTTVANQWQEITVSMSALGNPTAIKRLNIQNNSSNSVTAYFDNIRFETASSDTQAPTSPTNLTASGISQTGLTLNWTASTDNVGVVSYQVYQNGSLLNGNVTSNTLAVSGLTCGTQYNFYVTAKDAAGNTSGSSNVITPSTLSCPDTQAPTSPTNLTASGISQTGLTLNWTASTDNVGVVSYQVYRNGSLLNGTVTGTTFSVTGLTCGTQYNFYVTAKDAAGNTSGSSNVITPSTLTCPDTQAPTSPTNLTASGISQTGLTLNWTASTDNVGVVSYQVYQNGSLLNGNVSSNTLVVSGLTCSTQYNFYVTAKDAAGNTSGSSNVITPSTLTCPDTQAPTSPTNLTASGISQTGLTLNWTASTDNVGVVSYQVYRNGSLLNGNVTSNTLAVSGLTCGTQYNFYVTAKDAAGNTSGSSNVITPSTLTCPDTQAPTSPTNLTASGISQTGLTLNWTASTDNVGVVSYQVYRNGSLLNGTVTGTTFSVTGLTCGTQYSFYITAKDAAGNTSGSSTTITPTTSSCTASTITIYDETLNADWNDWSWACTRNYSNTSPVKVGTYSARVDYTAWGGLSFRKVSTTVTTTSSTAVRFWVRTPTATTIKVYTSATDTGGDATGYTFSTSANTWQEYIVTLSQLGNPTQIKRVNFQNYTSNNVTIYYDNVRLVSVQGARIGQTEEENLAFEAFPNPSEGNLQVRYNAAKVEKIQLQVVQLDGTLLQSQEQTVEQGDNLIQIDLRHRPEGLYLLRLQAESGVVTKKVVLQR